VIGVARQVGVPVPRRQLPSTRPLAAAEPAQLIGRQVEIAAVGAALNRALAGVSQIVEVTGDPGIGKTALLAAAGLIAQRRSVAIMWASASAAPGGTGALADRLAALGADERRKHPDALAGLGLIATADRSAGAVSDHRFAAERALLRTLSAPRGLLLLLDDLHHGDDQVVALIADLLARPLRAPLLVVYAYRDRQACAALRSVADQRGSIARLPLGPMTEAECGQLAGAVTPSRLRVLHCDSHGIPLYLKARLRALAGGSAVEQVALLTELDSLSPNARRMVSAAAVLGGEMEPGIVAAMAELPESTQYTVFDELCRHDLLRPVPGTGRFGFRHPLVGEVVYQATEPGWRLAAHAMAAQILMDRRASARVLAPHVVLGAVPVTAEAVTDTVAILVDGAATIRSQSPQIALQWLEAAHVLLPDDPGSQDDRADLLLELALTLGTAGRVAEARETLHRALPLLRPGLTARRLRAVTFCSQLERLLDHRSEARALLRRELDGASAGSAYSAALMTELAGNELVDGQLAEARTWATQALAAARHGGIRHVEATGHGVIAMADCLDGNVLGAAAELAQATPLLDGLLDSELAILPEAAIWTGCTELMLGRPWDALRHVDRALAAGHTAEHQLGVAYLLMARIVILASVGRFMDAGTAAEELAELAVTTGARTLQEIAAAAGAWISVWTGADPAASYRPRSDPGGLDGLGWFAVTARGMRAEVLLEAGDPGGCSALLLADGRKLPAADAWSRVYWCELLTRSAMARGRSASVREWAVTAASAAARLTVPGLNGIALLAMAQGQAVREPSAAAVNADIAAAVFASGGGLADAGRARVVAATARLACGQIEVARIQFAEVQAAYEQGGAVRRARQTAKLKMMTVSRVRSPGEPAALTVRERQVAALVAEGATNRQIARQLDVKEKTVEMHLSRIFVKLGVVNRVGVALNSTGAERLGP
jgi:DNA-binding CsgD family transcriptional regulator